mmetsp:Transcript_19634/g.39038  ORF Transcript_19634/g.39038 Transcript_19634/m.39038 type:complete len:347 (+) Transcript_19634:27-1067(+)
MISNYRSTLNILLTYLSIVQVASDSIKRFRSSQFDSSQNSRRTSEIDHPDLFFEGDEWRDQLVFSYSFSDPPTHKKNNCNLTDAERDAQIREILGKVSTVVRNSPQEEALDWIISEDIRFLCPNDPSIVQRYAVATFYFSTDGRNWKDQGTALSSESECSWKGALDDNEKPSWSFICENNYTFSVLSIDSNNLRGTLPKELGLFSGLEQINIDDNIIGGPLPVEIGQLKRLKRIDVDNNSFTGTLPIEIFTLPEIIVLDMNSNNFSGTISGDIKNLGNLEFMDISDNSFDGSLPEEFGFLSNLGVFLSHDNQLTGTMPTKLCSIVPQEALIATCSIDFTCGCCTCV